MWEGVVDDFATLMGIEHAATKAIDRVSFGFNARQAIGAIAGKGHTAT